MKTVTQLDKTQRLVLTKAMRDAAGISNGEKLLVTAMPGQILISPARRATGRIVRKGKAKVFTGDIPDVDVAEAVNAARHYTR
jgi:bifunctional DNA-binding transcriptional regulator/antitoxin component of YhaV-PrlF toxin-antitoxin module